MGTTHHDAPRRVGRQRTRFSLIVEYGARDRLHALVLANHVLEFLTAAGGDANAASAPIAERAS